MAMELAISAVKPRGQKPVFQPPPDPPTTPQEYFKSPFNPSKHLVYHGLPKRYTMKELSFPTDQGISPIAVSEPFQLFSTEAVIQMRNEVLSDEVWDNCRFSSSIAACQLRGMAPKYAKFVYDAWMDSETVKIISEVAGIDLIPNMDYEIGHINISMQSDGDNKSAPVVNWHRDSYPFVCVLMLSDTTGMSGGETALKTGTDDIMKVQCPQMGSAIILQGRYITHIALPSENYRERVTLVTSFRPKSPIVRDDSILATVRPISNLNELYTQWTEYRTEIVEERCRRLIKNIRKRKNTGRDFDIAGVKSELEELKSLLEQTSREIVGKEKDETESEQEEGETSKKRARYN